MPEHHEHSVQSMPPRWAVRLLRRYCPGRWMEEVEGDLEEIFHLATARHGLRPAQLIYWKEVVLFCVWHGLGRMNEHELTWSAGMFKNYLTVAWRNLRWHKGYALINVSGLAVGMACCLLILLLVRHEWSYDAFNEHADSIYRVYIDETKPDGSENLRTLIPPGIGAAMAKEFPAIEQYTNIVATHAGLDLKHGDRIFNQRLMMADSAFFQMFSFPLLAGDPGTALADPNGMVLTAAAARRFFGEVPPDEVLGKPISIVQGDTTYNYAVSAVVAPIPSNSSFQFDAMLSFENYGDPYIGSNDWGGRTSLYLKLRQGQRPEDLERALAPFTAREFAERIQESRAAGSMAEGRDGMWLRLLPLRQVHLTPYLNNDYEAPAHNPVYSYVLGGIALLVLLIACINFMILSVGRSATRAKEVGMRKVLGAQRRQVMNQFWGEALLMGVIALVLGAALTALVLPFFNTLTAKELALQDALSWKSLFGLIALMAVVGIVAGGYPAAVLSRLQPVLVLKGNPKARGSSLLMRGLVVVQYTLSIALIISTLVMAQQLRYMLNRDLGYRGEQVVVVHTYSVSNQEAPHVIEQFRSSLEPHRSIIKVAQTGYSFTRGGDWNGWTDAEGKQRFSATFGVDYDYLDVMGMELVAGRNFSREHPTDPTASVLVNEALVQEFGIKDPIGYKLTGYHSWYETEPFTIVGVVKDFNFQSLHEEVKPAVMNMHPDYYGGMGAILVKVRPEGVAEALTLIERTWKETLPGRPFSYSFLDDDVAQQYASERRWSRILAYSSVLAILISCMGLFGLATLTVARRTKEIGIRKVLGASASGITTLLSRDFLILVLISSLIAAPLAYVGMDRWLGSFAYRITIGPDVFIGAGLAALLIAILTVSYQSVKAALTDPVKSLRYE